MSYTHCLECGKPLEATVSIYVSNVELSSNGAMTNYEGTVGSEEILDDDNPRIYCKNDHQFELPDTDDEAELMKTGDPLYYLQKKGADLAEEVSLVDHTLVWKNGVKIGAIVRWKHLVEFWRESVKDRPMELKAASRVFELAALPTPCTDEEEEELVA